MNEIANRLRYQEVKKSDGYFIIHLQKGILTRPLLSVTVVVECPFSIRIHFLEKRFGNCRLPRKVQSAKVKTEGTCTCANFE